MKLRIKYLRQALGLTQSAFAAKAHVHKNLEKHR
ncbi:immunity repressor protein - phage associated [Streptococcus pyogenes]|nr:immunity repressor protein - phage associated [Streptococcus pyogenes]SQF63602.1 immunity repressor protein - phage associated [Streptococcus pyogenes]SUO64183.1 immunity repressor protein - phage associated [Streptococcus pyogenes]SUO64246.1 immunity repressor protein - phage associated [Streptococcus pyogenes]SUO64861.1 immunity repressor protein - phage associated [Streptococcus pyogenes]